MKDSNDATVGERLVERISLTQTLLDENERLQAEIARLRLTDAEREAIEFFVSLDNGGHGMIDRNAATLRTLLERTK